MNIPNKWVIIKIEHEDNDPIYKVLASWSGGYTTGDSWKLNSGIKEIKKGENYFDFIGYSGSIYRCDTRRYGMHSLSNGILFTMKKRAKETNIKVTLMEEDTNWSKLL